MAKKYGVDLYDMFDGWCHMADSNEYQYDDIKLAEQKRDELNSELNIQNKKAGEHYGIIDLDRGVEIDCQVDRWDL